jgi:hypothetical protein
MRSAVSLLWPVSVELAHSRQIESKSVEAIHQKSRRRSRNSRHGFATCRTHIKISVG